MLYVWSLKACCKVFQCLQILIDLDEIYFYIICINIRLLNNFSLYLLFSANIRSRYCCVLTSSRWRACSLRKGRLFVSRRSPTTSTLLHDHPETTQITRYQYLSRSCQPSLPRDHQAMAGMTAPRSTHIIVYRDLGAISKTAGQTSARGAQVLNSSELLDDCQWKGHN